TRSSISTVSAAKAGAVSATHSAAMAARRDGLPSMMLLLVRGWVAEHEFQEDAGRRPDEQPALAEFRQLHPRIGDAEAVEPPPHPVMIRETEGDMVDRLAGPG